MRIQLPSGTVAELTIPDGDPRRGVVLLPDIMGLRPLYDELCARLAAEHGWAICAPEPFPGQEALPIEERLDLLPTLDDDRHLGDAQHAADALRAAAGVDPIAVLGFCMGGGFALKASGMGVFDRAVAFYGMPKGVGSAPLRLAPQVTPVLAIMAMHDTFVPHADIDELEAAGATVVRYADAEHGFVHDPSRPSHRPDDAADAWRRSVDFLRISAP